MAQVHTFPLIDTVYLDTRLPLQYPGNGADPEALQVEISLLLAFLEEQLAINTPAQTVSTGGTIVVDGGNLIEVIAIDKAVGARTVKVGTTAGAEDIVELSDIAAGSDFSYTLNRYTSVDITLHFTITGGTASVIVFKRKKA